MEILLGVRLTEPPAEQSSLRRAGNDKGGGRRRPSGWRSDSGAFLISRSSRSASSGGHPAWESWRSPLSLLNRASIPAGVRRWETSSLQEGVSLLDLVEGPRC